MDAKGTGVYSDVYEILSGYQVRVTDRDIDANGKIAGSLANSAETPISISEYISRNEIVHRLNHNGLGVVGQSQAHVATVAVGVQGAANNLDAVALNTDSQLRLRRQDLHPDPPRLPEQLERHQL